MSNMGEGFLGFQARMAAIVEALGEPRLQPYVASEFRDRLVEEMKRVRGIEGYGRDRLPTLMEWTLATPAEFDVAGRTAQDMMGVRNTLPIIAKAPFRGCTIVLRDRFIWAEGGGYCLLVANAYEDTWPTYDRRTRRDEKKWHVSLAHEWEQIFPGPGGKPSRISVANRDSAIKSLRNMVKSFMGVDLV